MLHSVYASEIQGLFRKGLPTQKKYDGKSCTDKTPHNFGQKGKSDD